MGREQARLLALRLPIYASVAHQLSKAMAPDANRSSPEGKVEQKGEACVCETHRGKARRTHLGRVK